MRKWNGWGDESVTYHLPESARDFLDDFIGPLDTYPDANWEDVFSRVPKTRLPQHAQIETDADVRVMHALGQSLPDWIAIRYGTVDRFPDGIAFPNNREEIKNLLTLAYENDIRLIPYGGGTSVVGHINPPEGETPVLSVNMGRMNRLLELDEVSHLATIQAGANGPWIEEQLKKAGYTLGHFPQSFELSTLGGWIATRSSGQQSYHYGRIEDLFAGGTLETPQGRLELPPLPASAAGPDIRQMILGSEGRLGVITQAMVRVQPLPEEEGFFGVFFRDWESGAAALRTAAQEGVQVSMLRLSDPQETETTLILSGKDDLVGWADRGLNMLKYGEGRCLLIYGLTGKQPQVRQAQARAKSIFRAHGGLYTGKMIGKIWQKSRFHTPYLRNTLWEAGVALDTLETAMPWENILRAAGEIKTSITQAFEAQNERVLVFAHLSHVYKDGASIYITFLFRRTQDAEELMEHWQKVKQAASKTILKWGGTISHQHGVGSDHAPYLAKEKGEVGMQMIKAMSKTLDPKGLLNPGKLFK